MLEQLEKIKRNEYVPKCTRMVRYGKENGGGMVRLYTAQLLLLLIRTRSRAEAEGWKEPGQTNIVHTGMYQKVHEIAIYLQNHSAGKLCPR